MLLPEGAALLPVILYSDKTRLTVIAGDKQAWPVYITLGNFKKSIRNRLSSNTWTPIAYIPIPKFLGAGNIAGLLAARFWHQCMSLVFDTLIPFEKNGARLSDSFGNIRLCFPQIAVYMSDYPEQCLNLTIGEKSSPVFQASYEDLGDDEPGELRDYDSIMEVIHQLREEFDNDMGDEPEQIGECMKAARERGFIGVLYPWWEHHVRFQPWRCIVPDILHGLHKFFRDHPFKWIQYLVGKQEYDSRLSALQPLVGIRHFGEGISHLTQLTGREHRELQRTAVALAFGSSRVTPDVLKAFRAICDLIQVLQYESHNNTTLGYAKTFLSRFHRYKKSFISTGARRGDSAVINHFRIPKLYALHSYAVSIVQVGSSQQYSTEYGERAHIPLAKDLYRGTNHRNFGPQMCRALDRKERMRNFKAFLTWEKRAKEDLEIEESLEGFSRMEREVALAHLQKLCEKKNVVKKRIGYESNDGEFASYRLAKMPTMQEQKLTLLAQLYNLPDLLPALTFFVTVKMKGPNPNPPYAAIRSSCMYPNGLDLCPLSISHANVWLSFRLASSTIQDEDVEARTVTVQALPPSDIYPFGRCNTILVADNEEAERTSIEGMYNIYK